MGMTSIDPKSLDDASLFRELGHAHSKWHDAFLQGSAHSFATLGRRITELELEYIRRFPAKVTDVREKYEMYAPEPDI